MSDARIEILVAIDAETLIDEGHLSQKHDAPTSIDSAKTVYMIVKNDEAISGQAGNELKVAARTNDLIQWRETSLSLNSEYAVLFYQFRSGQKDLISTPQLSIVSSNFPYPNPDNHLEPMKQTIQGHVWFSLVEEPGDVTYHFDFMIVDRDNKILGYCTWDPFIHITQG